MAIELKMPALSPTMEEGTLAKWLVKAGDEVRAGDILAEIETDKATMEFEAVDEGVIAEILVAEGTEGVKVGTVIATIQGEGEDAAPAAATPAVEQKVEVSEAAPSVEARAAPAVAIAPKVDAKPAVDPEIPAGTPMVPTTVREALREIGRAHV